jgi:tight adherence protein C
MTSLMPILADIVADPALPYALAGAVVACCVAAAVMVFQQSGQRAAVQRRLRVDDTAPRGSRPAHGAPAAGRPTVTDRIVERATVFVRLAGPEGTKQLKQRLVRAGYFDTQAVPLFFAARGIGAVVGVAAVFVGLEVFQVGAPASFWMFVSCGGVAGYLLPNLWLNRRAKHVLMENRLGFPDFMDLMGVCANAGLSMEAALERVSRELAEMYPVLGVHLQILCLEVRAGRSLEDALHAMADRMDIAEVRAFATLLQQSKELGSSLSDALRVFSDDMRHKRLSMAEEKAYALPAKLSVPVSACILPVVLFIAVLPVIVRFNIGID